MAASASPCAHMQSFKGGALDTTTLFLANIVILLVMAIAKGVAAHGRRDEEWWRSWAIANVVIALSLALYTVDQMLPPLAMTLMPDIFLIIGFGLRWKAARQFSGRTTPWFVTWGGVIFYLLAAGPFVLSANGVVLGVANIALTAQTALIAYEFWRDRHDGFPSRYWLILAYVAMGLSFGYRIFVGLLDDGTMPAYIPQDTALAVHLAIALFHTVAGGAFALSLAYERGSAALRFAAMHDSLTQLLNRNAFEMRLRSYLAEQKPFALALIDIDRFKTINDRFGHGAGDAAIRTCAQICREMVGDRGTVARIGGEEFTIIFDAIDPEEAAAFIETIRERVAQSPVVSGSATFGMTISGGVCHIDQAPSDFEELMRLVDKGLYESKKNGRNRITIKQAA
ncbi:diguanylate cyclase (GGDEF)-like protein [Aminobacter sp. J44]|nr:diguanylate cyclase (GGDEF)-like protein [Aminobacter sp. J44]